MHQPHRQGEPDGKGVYMCRIYRSKRRKTRAIKKMQTKKTSTHGQLAREVKVFYQYKYLFVLNIEESGGKDGESICKPGSVEDSHSSTTAITDCL